VGKTSIALQFAQRSFSDQYEQTSDVSEWYTKQIEMDDLTINVDVVDFSGNESYKSQRQKVCTFLLFIK
jgi:GTPase SAR1 family protein